jgi:nitroreductase/dihydropteridine reductase
MGWYPRQGPILHYHLNKKIMSTLIDRLNWRYATKRMTGQKIPGAKIETILEAIRLSASSAGLQPYTIFVISKEALKNEIHEKACHQPQVLESSHLLVFASKTNVTDSYIKEVVSRTARLRNVPPAALDGYFNMVKNHNDSQTEAQRAIGTSRQAYIALGTALVAAAFEAVDASPMEGFNPARVDEILGLKEKGLQSVVLLALGYRNTETDFLAKAEKARKPKDELFIEID